MTTQEMEDWLDQVDYLTGEVNDIISGKIDITASMEKEETRKAKERIAKEEKEHKERARLEYGKGGKGVKFDTFVSYCKRCGVEFQIETTVCPRCMNETQSSEERKEELMAKLEVYKTEKNEKARRRLQWENWVKTQSMLHRKTSTNYRKWDYFESSEEEEEQPDFEPPDNDPNFKAMEQDIKERAARRKEGKRKAEELKEVANKFMAEGKYRNAIAKYEEAMQCKKDWMILYTNASLARLRLEEWDKVVEECGRVVEYYEVFEEELPPNRLTYFKALTRRGQAYRGLDQLPEAVADFKTALEQCPNDKDAKILFDRYSEELRLRALAAANEQAQEVFDSQDPEEMIKYLENEENMMAFTQTGGTTELYRRIDLNSDAYAFQIIQAISKDESRYHHLEHLIAKVHNKREIGAILLLRFAKKNPDRLSAVLKILQVGVENNYIRDELMRHSATTKGQKVSLKLFKLTIKNQENKDILDLILPVISNLCLSVHKSVVVRDVNPGDMKSIFQGQLREFMGICRAGLKEELHTSTLGLLCNVTTVPVIKQAVINDLQLVAGLCGVLGLVYSSAIIERGLGVFINCLSSQDTIKQEVQYMLLTIIDRIATFSTSTETIDKRWMLLLYRTCTKFPEFIDYTVTNNLIYEKIGKCMTTNWDTASKIMILCAAKDQFTSSFNIDTIVLCVSATAQSFLNGKASEEIMANSFLFVGNVAEAHPECLVKLQPLITNMLYIAKDKTGPVRKNAAIGVARLAKNEENLQFIRSTHGIEILASLVNFIT